MARRPACRTFENTNYGDDDDNDGDRAVVSQLRKLPSRNSLTMSSTPAEFSLALLSPAVCVGSHGYPIFVRFDPAYLTRLNVDNFIVVSSPFVYS